MAKKRKQTPARNPVVMGLRKRNRVAGPIPTKKGRGSVYVRRNKHSKNDMEAV